MSRNDYLVEEYRHGRCNIKIEVDQDPPNPRKEYDNVGTMVNWHDRYNLGDVNGRKEYGDGEDFIRALAGDHTKRDVQELDIEKCYEIVHKWYVVLPLGLYDHSGISMFVGGRGDVAGDSAGWDTSNIGYIYCSLKKAYSEWGKKGQKGKGWDGEASYSLKPDGTTRTLREAAENYLRGEVETYDQYLTGECYGYIVEADDGEEDSCWGFLGDIKYCKGEAEESADYHNERQDKADADAIVSEAKENAEAAEMACRDIATV